MVEKAEQIFRDFETDGVPASGKHKPRKREIRAWGRWIEDNVQAGLSNGGLIYDNRANLYADLAHAANSSAWVVADSTLSYNGIYRKSGASGTGSWTKIAELPYSVIYAQNAGTGTADAVEATSAVPISTSPHAQLISVPFTAANTAAMTLSINGETPRPLVTNVGAAIPAGYVQAGMAALVQIDGEGNYRLFSYGDASAIQAAAEAAQLAAEAAQTAAEDAADRAETAAGGVEYPLSYGVDQTALTPAQRFQARKNAGLEPPVRTGLVAGPGRMCTAGLPDPKQIMSRTAHYARDDMFNFQLVYANWFVGWAMGGSGHPYEERGPGAPAFVRACIEYPEGNIILSTHRVRWSGGTTVEIANGGQVTSDPIAVHIPKGAKFFVRTYMTCAAGLPVQHRVSGSAQQFNQHAHQSEFGETGITDLTAGGDISVTSHSTGVAYGPLAIIGPTREPSVLILGDSKTLGANDVADASVDMGMVARSIGKEFAYILCARDGEWAAEFLASNTRRLMLANWCTHVIWAYGANDMTQDSASANTLESRTEAGVASFPDHPVFVTTIEPISSSTDAWETWQNQTPHATNSVRVDYNGRVRAGNIAGAAGFFDLADAVERGRDTGLWQVPDDGTGGVFTDDGLHPLPHATKAARDRGVIPPEVFRHIIPQPFGEASIEQILAGLDIGKFISPRGLRTMLRPVLIEDDNLVFWLFDSIQICVSRNIGAQTVEQAVANVFQSAEVGNWVFPMSFSGAPLFVACSAAAISRWVNAAVGSSTGQASFRHFGPASNSVPVQTFGIAVGRALNLGA